MKVKIGLLGFVRVQEEKRDVQGEMVLKQLGIKIYFLAFFAWSEAIIYLDLESILKTKHYHWMYKI